MTPLITTYERYLKKSAEAARPAQRQRVAVTVMWPWILGAMVAFLLVKHLDLPRNVGVWIVAPTTCLAAAGAFYAGWRVAMYGWQFDRTPTPAAWTEKPDGEALIHALRRVTLNGLANVALSTRLQADLKLTSTDMSRLLDILRAEGWMDAPSVEGMKRDDLTVEALLGLMAPV